MDGEMEREGGSERVPGEVFAHFDFGDGVAFEELSHLLLHERLCTERRLVHLLSAPLLPPIHKHIDFIFFFLFFCLLIVAYVTNINFLLIFLIHFFSTLSLYHLWHPQPDCNTHTAVAEV